MGIYAASRRAVLGPLSAAVALLSFAALAEAQGRALGRGTRSEAKNLGVAMLEVEATARTLALRGVLGPEGLVFWSCEPRQKLKACRSTPPTEPGQALHIALDPKWLSLPVQVHREQVDEGALLHLVIAANPKPYHLVVVPGLALKEGSAVATDSRQPRLALKGALSAEEHSLERGSDGHFDFVHRKRACGRPTDALVTVAVHRLSLADQSFVESDSLPLPAPTDAEVWRALGTDPKTRGLGLAVQAGPGTSEGAEEWGFGNGGEASGSRVFSFLSGPTAGALRVTLRKSDGQLWLQGAGATRAIRFESGAAAGAAFDVTLPRGAGTESTCWTLHARDGAEVVGVSEVAPNLEAASAVEQVHRLGGPDSASYERSLLGNSREASPALASEYASLSERARERAFRVIKNLPPGLDVEPFLAVYLSRDRRAPLAREHLSEFDRERVLALLEQAFLSSTPLSEARIAGAYIEFSPLVGARSILRRIERDLAQFVGKKARVARARRAALRGVLGEAMTSSLGASVKPESRLSASWVDALLGDASLGPIGKLELERALPSAMESAVVLENLSAQVPNFTRDYLLLDARLRRFSRLPRDAQQRLTEPSLEHAGWSKLESEAYEARLLQLLVEHELPQAELARFRTRALGSLESSARRLREAALQLFSAKAPILRLDAASRKRLLETITDDPWLEVQAAAAVALGSQLKLTLDVEEKAESEKFLAKRLFRTSEPLLSRALVKGLAESGGPKARLALHEGLDDKHVPSSGRAEAALALGKLCEKNAVPSLERYALSLGSRPTDAGQVELGLAAVRALKRLSPETVATRLSRLMRPDVPGPIRGQVELMIEQRSPSCNDSARSPH